jgi:hypothetical protein
LDLINYYAKAPTSTYFHNEFTIVIWFNKFYGIFSNANLALIDFSFDNSRNIGLAILNNNNILFWIKNSNGSIIKSESNFKINNKEWYHIALTYSNSSRLIYLYVNGILVSSHYVDLILGETNLNYIGKSDTLNISGSEILIDEIRIYNRVLNNNEILTDSNDRPIATTTTTTTRATTRLDECTYYYCYNGGTCYTDYNGNAYCKCTYDYYGYDCLKSNFFSINNFKFYLKSQMYAHALK